MTWPRMGHVVKGKTIEIQLPWSALTAMSKTGKFIPAGAWSLLGDYTHVRSWGELVGTTGDIQVTPAVQVATDPRKPGNVVGTSTTFNKEGFFDTGRLIQIEGAKGKAATGATYVRVGWLVASPTGTVVHATAGGMIELSAGD